MHRGRIQTSHSPPPRSLLEGGNHALGILRYPGNSLGIVGVERDIAERCQFTATGSPLLAYKTQAQCLNDGFDPCGHGQLEIDPGQMPLDRLLRRVQDLADGPGGLSRKAPFEDFLFARRETDRRRNLDRKSETRIGEIELHRDDMDPVQMPVGLGSGVAACQPDPQNLAVRSMKRNPDPVMEAGGRGFRKNLQVALAEMSGVDDLLPRKRAADDAAVPFDGIGFNIARLDIMSDPVTGIISDNCRVGRQRGIAGR